MSHDVATELAAAVLPDGRELTVRLAREADVETILDVVHRAFASRPVLGAQPEALRDDAASVRARLQHGVGYLAELAGEPVGVIMVARRGQHLRLGRVCVAEEFRQLGIASFMVEVVLEHQASLGEEIVTLLARKEYPQIRRWWERHGFRATAVEGDCHLMTRALPLVLEAPDTDAMRALGERLATALRPGDLIIASGDLGAGKTTLTQGIGAGLGVRGPVISPTFVLSRVHPNEGDGPGLVHVDAYRLGSFAELEDIDLETSLDDSVTLVEWGEGIAEGLAPDRLEIDIRRGLDPADDTRWVFLTPIGPRWSRDELARATASAPKEES